MIKKKSYKARDMKNEKNIDKEQPLNAELSRVIANIKHPMQPDWVIYDLDVNKFLKLLDEEKNESTDERQHYPPYMCFIAVNKEGEENLAINYSKWYGKYDPNFDPPHLVTMPMGESGIS